jgi:hypothetical protein
MAKYNFPYSSLEAAVNDKWKKAAGYTAMQILQAGWYQLMNRKDRNVAASAINEAIKEDPAFKQLIDRAKARVAAKNQK